MSTSGLVMILIGVVVVAQVARGGALQRLGIMSCPAGSGTPQNKQSSVSA